MLKPPLSQYNSVQRYHSADRLSREPVSLGTDDSAGPRAAAATRHAGAAAVLPASTGAGSPVTLL